MRLPGRHHRGRHSSANSMKSVSPPATTAVRFAAEVRTAAELVAERDEHPRNETA
jgi:hypothetical protein